MGIAIDDVPDFYNMHLGALSQKLGEVKGTEGGWLDDVRDDFLALSLQCISVILKGYIRHCWHDVMGQYANDDGESYRILQNHENAC